MFPASEELLGCHEGVEILKDCRTNEISVRLDEPHITIAKRHVGGIWRLVRTGAFGIEWAYADRIMKSAQHKEATRYVVCRNLDQGPGESTVITLAPGSIVIVVDDHVTAMRFSDLIREDGSTIKKLQPKGKDDGPGST